MKRLSEGTYWLETKGSKSYQNIYMCWYVVVGNIARIQFVHKTLIGKVRPKP